MTFSIRTYIFAMYKCTHHIYSKHSTYISTGMFISAHQEKKRYKKYIIIITTYSTTLTGGRWRAGVVRSTQYVGMCLIGIYKSIWMMYLTKNPCITWYYTGTTSVSKTRRHTLVTCNIFFLQRSNYCNNCAIIHK